MPSVLSADRTLSVFEAFEVACRPLPLSELAASTNVPVSSCHALVQTLLERGYLYSVGRRKTLYPTRRLFELAQTVSDHDPVLERIAPRLRELRDRCKETVIVGKRQGDAVLYLDVVAGLHTVRYTARAGEYKPLHSSAIGKALLGSLEPVALKLWLGKRRLARVTPHTLTEPQRLAHDLAVSARRGYYVTRGENVVDVTAVAVPVVCCGEQLGVALAGPSHRMQTHQGEMAARLKELARQLNREAR